MPKTSLAKKASRARSQSTVQAKKAHRQTKHALKHPNDKQTTEQAKKANLKGVNGYRKPKPTWEYDTKKDKSKNDRKTI